MTDDLRKDIEEAYASVETQSDEFSKPVAVSEENNEVSREPTEVISAPNSYKQEYKDDFNTLPLKWQEYLATREKEVEQGLSRARNNYSWVEKAFHDRKDSLSAQGYHNAEEYFKKLIDVADALEKNPTSTLNDLKSIYGVFDEQEPLQRRLTDLQNQLTEQQKFIQMRDCERAQQELAAFLNAKDDSGCLKHVYFDDVKDEMKALLRAGLATNYEDAYNQSLWRVESVRQNLLRDMAEAEIKRREHEAQKIKDAGFYPSSKADAKPKVLSLREEIERNYDLLGEYNDR